MIFADLLPQLLFLVIFSPSNPQKTNDDSPNGIYNNMKSSLFYVEIDWNRDDSSDEIESPLYR